MTKISNGNNQKDQKPTNTTIKNTTYIPTYPAKIYLVQYEYYIKVVTTTIKNKIVINYRALRKKPNNISMQQLILTIL
jgi:hypothetical protein